jgi:hypothetical protein
VEVGLYLSSTAFITSVLLKALNINPWFWHILSISLAVVPLVAIAIMFYNPKPQQYELLAVLNQKQDEPGKRQEWIGLVFKWWVLRLMWISCAIELVFWGYL